MHLLANYRTIQPPLRLGSVVRLTTTLPLSTGEGRGEEALLKTSEVSPRRFQHWFVGRNVMTSANPAQNVRPDLVAADVRRLTIIPRSAPVPRRKLHLIKSWFLSANEPNNANVATPEYLSTTPAHGTLSSILLNGGEGRGEEALIKTSNFPSRRFHHWFLGRFHGAKSWFSKPANLGASPCRPGPLTRRRPPWRDGIVESLTTIPPLPKGEGRGEGEAPKQTDRSPQSPSIFKNEGWFLGRNIPPSLTNWFSQLLALGTPCGAALAILALALLTGCAVGPDYKRPAATTTTLPDTYAGATNGWKLAAPQAQFPKGNWWEVFGDPELNSLETQASGGNLQLQAAVARFDEARAQMDVTRAGLFPSVDLSGSATRQRVSPNTPSLSTGQPIGQASTYNEFTLPLDFTYELDLWGRVRRSVESARAQTQASADDLATIKLAIQAEVAVDYFTLRALDSERAVLRSSIIVFSKSLDLTKSQRTGGIATDLEVAQAETVLKTTQAQIPAVSLQRAQLEHALAVLTGQPATTFRIAEQSLAVTPPAIPPGMPSELLERRPDISAAERRMAAANASIGVAKAAFYPTIQLDGLVGLESVNAGAVFNASSRMWAVGPSVTLPIFEGGRLRAGLRLSQATYEEMVANYRDTVLNGFAEVEDSLSAQTLLASQYDAVYAALLAARRELEIANNRYRDGLITYLDVATAENTTLNLEFSTVQLRGQQLVAAITLVKSLGGGWSPASQ